MVGHRPTAVAKVTCLPGWICTSAFLPSAMRSLRPLRRQVESPGRSRANDRNRVTESSGGGRAACCGMLYAGVGFCWRTSRPARFSGPVSLGPVGSRLARASRRARSWAPSPVVGQRHQLGLPLIVRAGVALLDSLSLRREVLTRGLAVGTARLDIHHKTYGRSLSIARQPPSGTATELPTAAVARSLSSCGRLGRRDRLGDDPAARPAVERRNI
jgi:hypothetical protein